jgi:hypothetical protein
MADTSPLGDLIESITGAIGPSAPERTSTAPPPVPAARRVPPPQPDRTVYVRLGSGRRIRARIAPAVARRDDLAAVASAAGENDARAFDALRRHRRAIAELQKSYDELSRKVEALERRPSLTLGALPPGVAALEQQVRDLQLLSVKSQIQGAASVVNSLQATAYGDKGSLFTTNNLLLAGNQLFWNLLDPVLRAAGLANASTATVLAAVAPFATLFAGEILVGTRQQARFISGTSSVTDSGVVREILPVADHLRASFRARTDVPVMVSALDPISDPFNVTGRVVDGVLEIRLVYIPQPPPIVFTLALGLPSPPPPVRVAWTVDLGENLG